MRATWSARSHHVLMVVVAVVVIAAAASAPGNVIDPAPAAAQTAPAYTIEVTPKVGLTDGQAMQVVVRAEPGHRLGDSGIVRACRDGVPYQVPDDVNPLARGNCPDRPVTSSASDPWPIRSYPDGSVAVTTFRAGVGTVQWGPATNPTQFSLTCDPTSPCRLVITINVDGRDIIDSSTVLTYSASSPVAACGGTDPDAIDTVGPDRISALWVSLTRQKCVSEGSKASSLAVLSGEGEGHLAFEQGRADVAYSAVGPTFPGVTPSEARPSTSVPFALNATVIGVLGGYPSTTPDWPKNVPRPYSDLKVTMAEMATLFGQGRYLFDALYFDALQQRNPQLLSALSLTNNDRGNPLAPAGAEATTWTATSAFDALAGDQWKSPPQAIAGNEPNAPRGVHESLAAASPPFTFSLFELYSSSGQTKRLVADFAFRPYSYGPIWVMTDLATARELGIPTVALQNSSGEFVQPTDDSLLAAAPSLQRQADGTYLPVVGAEGAGAYPLTFAEHAVAPTDKLTNAECVARTGAQQVLADWLTYLTGPGQAVLPDGMVPLPSSMAQGAATSLAAVGTTTAADCVPDPADPTDPDPTTPTTLPTGVDDPTIPSFPSGSSSSNLPTGGPSRASSGGGGTAFASEVGDGSPPSDAVPEDGAPDEVAIAEISYPDPTSGAGRSGVATGLALVVLAVLAAVGGWLSSGRSRSTAGKAGS